MLPKILEVYEGLDVWTEESLLDALKALVEELGVKNGQIYWPARIAITGCVSTAGGATEIAANPRPRGNAAPHARVACPPGSRSIRVKTKDASPALPKNGRRRNFFMENHFE